MSIDMFTRRRTRPSNPQVAAELILTYPQKQTLRSNGTDIGKLKHLPPFASCHEH